MKDLKNTGRSRLQKIFDRLSKFWRAIIKMLNERAIP